MLALEQGLEGVDAQAAAVAPDGHRLAAGAGDRVQRAGIARRLHGDAAPVGGDEGDGEADRLLRPDGDEDLLGGGRRAAPREHLRDQCAQLGPALRLVAVPGGVARQVGAVEPEAFDDAVELGGAHREVDDRGGGVRAGEQSGERGRRGAGRSGDRVAQHRAAAVAGGGEATLAQLPVGRDDRRAAHAELGREHALGGQGGAGGQRGALAGAGEGVGQAREQGAAPGSPVAERRYELLRCCHGSVHSLQIGSRQAIHYPTGLHT